MTSALEVKMNKEKNSHLSFRKPKTFDFSQNSSVPLHQVTEAVETA